MSNRMKKTSGAIKYLILIVLMVVLAIIFYTTQNNEVQEPSNINPSSPTSQQSNSSQSQPNDPIIPSSGTISGGGDVINVDNYTLYDTYVIASEQTKYSQVGYKYFIVRSYNEYEKYINNNLKSPFEDSYISKYLSINEETLTNIKNSIDKNFFKTNSLIFVVDYDKKEISASITNIQISDDTVSLSINRTITNENTSRFNTYIIPIESTNIRSVNINYIR